MELEFRSEELRDAGAFATKCMPEIKFQKMAEQPNDVLSFLKFLKRPVLCMAFKVNNWPAFFHVCLMRRRTQFILV